MRKKLPVLLILGAALLFLPHLTAAEGSELPLCLPGVYEETPDDCLTLGPSAYLSEIRQVDALAHGWYGLTGIHWGMGLEVTARKARLRHEEGAGSDAPTEGDACVPDTRAEGPPGAPLARGKGKAPVPGLRASQRGSRAVASTAGAHA